MASNTDDENLIRSDFNVIRAVYDKIRENEAYGLRGFNVVSMGMSQDYELAISEGSTLVRIGSSIFGNRQY